MEDPNKRFELHITAEIRSHSPTGGSDYLRVDETVSVGSCGFMEIAGILGEFHKLAEKIRQERQRSTGTR